MVKTKLLTQADLQEDGSPWKYMVWDKASNSLKWFNASADQAKANPDYDPAADPECGIWEGEKPYPRYDGTGNADNWSERTFAGQWGEANVREGHAQCWMPRAAGFRGHRSGD